MRTWTARERALVRAARAADPPVPWRALAVRLGATVQQITRTAWSWGVRTRPPRRLDLRALRRLRRKGLGDRAVAATLGIGYYTVRRHRWRLGL